MTKTETIISEFERFIQEYDRNIGFTSYDSEVLKGVLELLKARESVKPNEIRHGNILMYYQCSACTSALRAVDRYCSQCGKKVKWDA